MARARRSHARASAVLAGLIAATSFVFALGSARATFPGANGKLFFSSFRDGNFEIYSGNLDGTGLVNLTHNPAPDYEPKASADGTKIAFVSERDGNPEIYLMNLDGTGVTNLTNNPAKDYTPAFFPDGSLVFQSDRDGNPELYRMAADGSNVTRLTNSPGRDIEPAVSPDGTHIAFTSERDGNLEIYTMNADGTSPVNLTHNTSLDGGADFAPDGASLVFHSNRTGNFEIIRMGTDGSSPTNLTNSPASDITASYTPDGTDVLFSSNRSGQYDVWITALATGSALPAQEGPTKVADQGGEPVVAPKEAVACHAEVTRGWFEPTQAVWQDDPELGPQGSKSFPDKFGKQLLYEGNMGGPHYDAQIPMVRNKPTVLFGIDHSVNGPHPHDRSKIVMEGTTTCTKAVPVAMNFQLFVGSNPLVDITTSGQLGSVELEGDPGPEKSWGPIVLPVNTNQGIPSTPFTFAGPGKLYSIRDELIRTDTKAFTGLYVQVSGEVIDTRAPRLLFYPLILDEKTTDAQRTSLERFTKNYAEAARRSIPDYYPLRPYPYGIGIQVLRPTTIPNFSGQVKKDWVDWVKAVFRVTNPAYDDTVLYDAARLALVNRLYSGLAELGRPSGRVVVVLRDPDFDLASYAPASFVSGMTTSQKVIVIHDSTPVSTLGHELVHTLPFAWSSPEMTKECDVNYHNWFEHGELVKIAHGFQLTKDGKPYRSLRDPEVSIMGPAYQTAKGRPGPKWIDQCTYWHLTKLLQNPPDPSTILVSGRIARLRKKTGGELFPLYQMDGTVDLAAGTGGSWTIVLRDSGGAELGRFPFSPEWKLEDTKHKLNLLSFSYRVPDIPGVASVELVGPTGILDTTAYSAGPPSVSITTPADGATVTPSAGTAHVTWTGSDADGDPLLYSVLYSEDGGETWTTQSFEQKTTSFNVRLSSGTSHQIEVIVTDGARSSSDVVSFSTT